MSDLRDAAEKALEGWKDDAPSWWTRTISLESVAGDKFTGVVKELDIGRDLALIEVTRSGQPLELAGHIGAALEQKPVALPCCGYIDASAIKWNPFNGVVQCHNCGQTYAALRAALEQPERTLTDEVIADLWHQNGGFHHHFARAVERYLKGEK
jgi:hypothetical protein